MSTYEEDDYLQLSGIQHFCLLPPAMGIDPHRTTVGRESSDRRRRDFTRARS